MFVGSEFFTILSLCDPIWLETNLGVYQGSIFIMPDVYLL